MGCIVDATFGLRIISPQLRRRSCTEKFHPGAPSWYEAGRWFLFWRIPVHDCEQQAEGMIGQSVRALVAKSMASARNFG